MLRNVKKLTAFLLAALLCSSCGNNTPPVTHNSSSVSTAVTSVSEETTTAVITTLTAYETTTVTTVISETISSEETTTITEESVSETVTETSESETTVSETTTVTEAETTTEITTTTETTTAETEVISETSPPAAKLPPAEIKVSDVSSPGTLTEQTETALVDYSNASLGYISASYSGKSARAKLRIVCGDITCDHDLSVTGEMEYFPLMQGSGNYKIQIFEQLDGKLYSSALDLSVSVTITDEVGMYLYPNRYSMFDKNSACVVKASEVCAGQDDDIEKIAAIFGYVTDSITYDFDLAATVVSGYIPDPDKVLSRKTGICFDYASLFAAMARSQGIPARLVIGYAAPDIYHAWNEVYTEETGWITPELLLGRKGYNLVDATFYAGSDDKSAIAEYISDSGNYSAVYRY